MERRSRQACLVLLPIILYLLFAIAVSKVGATITDCTSLSSSQKLAAGSQLQRQNGASGGSIKGIEGGFPGLRGGGGMCGGSPGGACVG
ncbi:hypothetical protein O6H91_09G091500 [Diphasiastrum complanatum]|uniref:Uncharacterized protein n=1 Tax=Diphasiastrum complanatum TaxID=34168 RepID=A0ACC2CSC2_DIPCM|nr:hypothetical protein O6H91_09G091500 [Diphasiastrum complanatum]